MGRGVAPARLLTSVGLIPDTLDPDPDLARTRFRPLDIHHPQHLGRRAGAVIDSRFHRVPLTLGARSGAVIR